MLSKFFVELCYNSYDIIAEHQILPEEKFEASLDVPESVFLCPWRSVWAAKALDRVRIPSGCTSTVLKWEWEIPDINNIILNSNIKTVFCTSTGKRCPLATRLIPDYVASDIKPLWPKSGVFFMGWANNKLRKTIFSKYSGLFSVTLRDSYSSDERNKDHRQEYIKGLGQASFSLCPKGVGSGTKRFWESLAAGAIPILVSDEFYLPPVWDWDKTIIRISESRAMYSQNILYNCTVIKDIEERRAMCFEAYEFFSSRANISKYITDVINKRI